MRNAAIHHLPALFLHFATNTWRRYYYDDLLVGRRWRWWSVVVGYSLVVWWWLVREISLSFSFGVYISGCIELWMKKCVQSNALNKKDGDCIGSRMGFAFKTEGVVEEMEMIECTWWMGEVFIRMDVPEMECNMEMIMCMPDGWMYFNKVWLYVDCAIYLRQCAICQSMRYSE